MSTTTNGTATTTKTAKPTFWTERGEVACADHAPFKGSDTWVWERWRKMGAAAITQARAEWSIPEPAPICECCRTIARRN